MHQVQSVVSDQRNCHTHHIRTVSFICVLSYLFWHTELTVVSSMHSTMLLNVRNQCSHQTAPLWLLVILRLYPFPTSVITVLLFTSLIARWFFISLKYNIKVSLQSLSIAKISSIFKQFSSKGTVR